MMNGAWVLREKTGGRAVRVDERDDRQEAKEAIVIVTGASSGLGEALTDLLDQTLPLDVTLWLIARGEEKLEAVASRLRHPIRLLALDLTNQEELDRLEALLAAEKPSLHLLINNAGQGCPGAFACQSASSHEFLCDLNVRAQVAMTSLALPYMEEGSGLLFTASVAAFLPQPGFAAYAASKAFILSFGRALREELRPRGIQVTVTCPNPMLTDFFSPQQKQALLHSYKRLGLEEPGKVAEKTLAAMRRRRGVVVTSPAGRLIRLLAKVVPTSLLLRFFPWK